MLRYVAAIIIPTLSLVNETPRINVTPRLTPPAELQPAARGVTGRQCRQPPTLSVTSTGDNWSMTSARWVVRLGAAATGPHRRLRDR